MKVQDVLDLFSDPELAPLLAEPELAALIKRNRDATLSQTEGIALLALCERAEMLLDEDVDELLQYREMLRELGKRLTQED